MFKLKVLEDVQQQRGVLRLLQHR